MLTTTNKTVEIDWLNPTRLPAPPVGMEYDLHALDEPVHVLEGDYPDRPVHAHGKTVIRGGATVSAEKPGTKVVLGTQRPNTKEN